MLLLTHFRDFDHVNLCQDGDWKLLEKKEVPYAQVVNETVFQIDDQNGRFIKLRFDGIYSYASIQSLKFYGSASSGDGDEKGDEEEEEVAGGDVTSKMAVVQCSSAQSGANAVNLLKPDKSVWKPVLSESENSWFILDCDGYQV